MATLERRGPDVRRDPLLGVITATLASWFLTHARRAEEEAADLETRLAGLESQLGELCELLTRVPAGMATGPAPSRV